MCLFALLEIKMLCEGTANKNLSDVNECTVKNSNKNVSCLHLIIRKNKTGPIVKNVEIESFGLIFSLK